MLSSYTKHRSFEIVKLFLTVLWVPSICIRFLLYIQHYQGNQNGSQGSPLMGAELFPEGQHAGKGDDQQGRYTEGGVGHHRRDCCQSRQKEFGGEEIGDADEGAEEEFPEAGPFLFGNDHACAQHKGCSEGVQQVGVRQVSGAQRLIDFCHGIGAAGQQEQNDQAPVETAGILLQIDDDDGGNCDAESDDLHHRGHFPEYHHRQHHRHQQTQFGEDGGQHHTVFPDGGLHEDEADQQQHAVDDAETQCCRETGIAGNARGKACINHAQDGAG